LVQKWRKRSSIDEVAPSSHGNGHMANGCDDATQQTTPPVAVEPCAGGIDA